MNRAHLCKRILAGIAGLGIAAILLWLLGSFVGNPIRAAAATRSMQTYLREQYPHLPLVTEPARYNFKLGEYLLRVQSTESPDTWFTVHVREDGSIYDDYESYVPTGWNTLDRWGSVMTAEIDPLVRALYGDELTGRLLASFAMPEPGEPIPPLDAPFDPQAGWSAALYLDFTVDAPSPEALAERALTVYQAVCEAGYPVASVTIEIADEKREQGYLAGIDAKWLNERLAEQLIQALEEPTPEQDGLSVWRISG